MGLFRSVILALQLVLSTVIALQPTFAQVKEQSYDYIIVGGGLTGLVVANRLSEQQDKTVLVIENGHIDDSPATSIPYQANILNTGAMYQINSAPEPFLNNQTYAIRVGNVVGGGSVVNGMLFDRGSNADYNAWEQLGNKGWGWKDIGPYFRKSTNFTPPSTEAAEKFGLTWDASAYGNGPLQIHLPSFQYPDIKTIFGSLKAENIPMPREGFAEPVGAYWCPSNIDNITSTRSSARTAYYDPAASRPNLHLLAGTRVNRIVFDEKRKGLVANGVQIVSRADNLVSKVYAKKEVVLAAGSIFTPQLLMLSGIGPKEVLEAANISVKQDAPAVGANFQDHPPLTMTFNLSNQAFPDPAVLQNNATFNAAAAAQYALDKSGPYSFARGSAVAFLTFKQLSSKYQDITSKISGQDPVKFLPERYSKNKALLDGFKKQREILVTRYLGDDAAVGESPIQAWGRSAVALQKPLSRGIIILNSTHPEDIPIAQFNTIQNPIDAEVLCEMVRWNRRRWARKELAGYKPVENAPGAQYQTNDEILQESIKKGVLVSTFAHPSGSCAMMPRELGGCVGDKLLVYGVENLSIVDASIIPLIPATHLQATMYAIAEKAADIIKQR